MIVFSGSKFGFSGTLCCLHYLLLQGFSFRCRAVSIADGDKSGYCTLNNTSVETSEDGGGHVSFLEVLCSLNFCSLG